MELIKRIIVIAIIFIIAGLVGKGDFDNIMLLHNDNTPNYSYLYN
jgi:hypothetical protein